MFLIFAYPIFALNVKRYHDRDKSGWWLVVGLIPIIGPIWVKVELGFLKGTDGVIIFSPEYVPPPQPIPMLSCSECEYTVKNEDFKENNLFCPECGGPLEETMV